MPPAGPVRAFLSYAHEDHAWRDRVLDHIGWLRHSGQLHTFDDRQIKSGERWNPRIKRELEAAHLVLVLLSPRFVGSRFCSVEELVRAVERQRQGTADLVAVYCDWVDLEALPLAAHQVLPQDEANDLKPLSEWPNPNLPLSRVAAAVRQMVAARRAPAPEPPAEVAAGAGSPAQGIPPRGRFVGRQTDLEQLLAWIEDDDPRPIAVLGPGGIGKSKLTLAALYHERVAARFGDRRLFVRLEDAHDEAGVWTALAGELALEPGPHPAATTTAALRAAAPAPTLVVLDNAETPWEADLAAGSTAVEEAFARLAELPGVRLAASLRGFELPGTAAWRPLLVEPLPEEAARALFLDAAGLEGEHYRTDPELPRLLARLDGLPLAIELVALRAQAEPGAAAVLAAWEAEREAFVRRGTGTGGKKQLDLAASVALSLASPRMTEPGRRLFAVLGRLPLGLTQADLGAVVPATEAAEAARALRRTGLVLRDPARLRMLAPVREQAAAAPLGEAEQDRLAAHFGALADALPYLGNEPRDWVAARRAREELANIEAALALAPPAGDPTGLSGSGRRWLRVGDTRWVVGAVRPAADAYRAAHRLFERAVRADPGNASWQRDLSVSWDRLGDIRWARADLAGALAAYTRGKDIVEGLAAADPGNMRWQRDLSVSWCKLGEARQAQGDLAEALVAYIEDMKITKQLAAADPGNASWQRDLSVTWCKLGDVRAAQDDLVRALAAYTESKEIAERLAAADPGNASWQRDLSVTWCKLGDVRAARGDLTEAREAYEQDLAIAQKLAAADPSNAGWQFDLGVSYERIGNILVLQGKLAEAATTYQHKHDISSRLVASDPGNAVWRRDLSVSWNNLGDVRVDQGDLPGALAAYTEGKNIIERLAAADPGNGGWQRDLIISHERLAATQEQLPGREAEAASHWAAALEIARRLATEGRLAPADGHLVEELEQHLAASGAR
jgi:tetratricopeptide (TPR) repeat protein